MEIWFPRIENRIRLLEPVEFLILVDGKTIRAVVDWSVIEQLVGADGPNEEAVRDFIQQHRTGFEVAMKAHLFARGLPWTRQFVVTLEELSNFGPTSTFRKTELH
jgi:hypothetical protein